MASAGKFAHATLSAPCCSSPQAARRVCCRSRRRWLLLCARGTCNSQCPRSNQHTGNTHMASYDSAVCSSVSGSDATMLSNTSLQRRNFCLLALVGLTSILTVNREAVALPLAPLGSSSDTIGGAKLQQPSLKQVQEILARDLAEGQYFVTGDLTPEVFADDCRFVDPTNDVTGLSRYRKALTILFDPKRSEVKLKQIKVSGSDTIEADWTLGGVLKLPWQPRINTIDGHTVYTVNKAGLIQKQEQKWSISAWTALRQSFTPSFRQN